LFIPFSLQETGADVLWESVRSPLIFHKGPDAIRLTQQFHEIGLSYELLKHTPKELRWNLDTLAEQELEYDQHAEEMLTRASPVGTCSDRKDRMNGWRRDLRAAKRFNSRGEGHA